MGEETWHAPQRIRRCRLLPSLHVRDREPELMDEPGLAPEPHHAALDGLRRINFLSASAGILWPAIRNLARSVKGPLRLLDIGSGGGDVLVGLWRPRDAGPAIALDPAKEPTCSAHGSQDHGARGTCPSGRSGARVSPTRRARRAVAGGIRRRRLVVVSASSRRGRCGPVVAEDEGRGRPAGARQRPDAQPARLHGGVVRDPNSVALADRACRRAKIGAGRVHDRRDAPARGGGGFGRGDGFGALAVPMSA